MNEQKMLCLRARQAVLSGQAAQIEGQAKLSARRTRLLGQAGQAVGDVIGLGMDIYNL